MSSIHMDEIANVKQTDISVARGAVGAPAPLRVVKKNFRRNLQGKCVSAPQDTKCTPSQSKSQFLGHFFAGRVRFGGIFRPSFEGDD